MSRPRRNKSRSRLNDFADKVADFVAPSFRNHTSDNLGLTLLLLALEQAEYGGLARAASTAMKLRCPLVLVHVASKSANVGLVHFHFAAERVNNVALHRKPNTVKHEPRRLLRHSDVTVNL